MKKISLLFAFTLVCLASKVSAEQNTAPQAPQVSILGLDLIGLSTAIVAAEHGYMVNGYDVSEEKIQQIKAGNPVIVEPGATEHLRLALANPNFNVSTILKPADYFIITATTTLSSEQTADLSRIFDAIDQVATHLKPGNTVILTATLPPGATEKVSQWLAAKSGLQPEIDFFVAYCPERAIANRVFIELISNKRIIGGRSEQGCERAAQFYSVFTQGSIRLASDKVTELVKIIENCSRDVQIAFANQVEALCKTAGLDVRLVIECANEHPRVNILSPTCGVGGSGMATDSWFLIESFPQDTTLQKTVRKINNDKPLVVLNEVLDAVKEFITTFNRKPKLLVLGVTYKPDVDDLSESPALAITKALTSAQDFFNLRVYDPHAHAQDLERFNLPYVIDLTPSLDQADIVLTLVKHTAFKQLNPAQLAKPWALIDTCGLMHDIKKLNN